MLGTLGETLALNYLTEIWGVRPDVRSVTSAQAQTLLAEGAPLAVTEAALPLVAAEVSPAAHYSALGRTLVALSASPTRHLAQSGATALGELRPWQHDFGGELQLQAGRIGIDRATGETVALLIWQATAPPSQDWAVSVRLPQGGQEIAQLDREHPVSGAYPTSRWAPGEVVADAYPFALPPDATPDGLKWSCTASWPMAASSTSTWRSFPLPEDNHGAREHGVFVLLCDLRVSVFVPVREVWLLGQEFVLDQPGAQLNACGLSHHAAAVHAARAAAGRQWRRGLEGFDALAFGDDDRGHAFEADPAPHARGGRSDLP